MQATRPLPSSAWNTALLPFWDDIDSESGNVYWEERSVGGIQTLIVQWDDRPHFNNVGSATFQLQLFASGPVAARFAYEDVDFGNPAFNFGASATIGYQVSQSQATQFSFNSPVLSNGDALDLLLIAPTIDVDEYTLDLTASVNRSVDVILSGSSASFASSTLELLEPGGAVVALGQRDALGRTRLVWIWPFWTTPS